MKISNEIRDLQFNVKSRINKTIDPNKFVNFTQYQIIRYLMININKEVCQKDLEIETKLNKASITGALDNLEEKGLVLRKQSLEDKRKNIIAVTDKSKKLIGIYETAVEEVDNKMIEGISEEELNTFLNVINKMNKNLA